MIPPEDIYNRMPRRGLGLSNVLQSRPGAGSTVSPPALGVRPSLANVPGATVPAGQPAPAISSVVGQPPAFDPQVEAQRRAAESMAQFHDTLMQLQEGPETYNIMGQSHPGANNSLTWDQFQQYWAQNPFVSAVMGGQDPTEFYLQDMQNRPGAYGVMAPNMVNTAAPTLSSVVRPGYVTARRIP